MNSAKPLLFRITPLPAARQPLIVCLQLLVGQFFFARNQKVPKPCLSRASRISTACLSQKIHIYKPLIKKRLSKKMILFSDATNGGFWKNNLVGESKIPTFTSAKRVDGSKLRYQDFPEEIEFELWRASKMRNLWCKDFAASIHKILFGISKFVRAPSI